MENGEGSYRRFLDGDDSGMVEIIRDYKDGLILYINGFTSDIRASEELAKEAFFKLAVKKPRFSGRSSFKTWLYAIGRNAALDNLRRRRSSREASLTGYEDFVKDEEELERNYLKEERKIILHRVLSGLKPEYRQVLWLVYFENFSNSQTAQIMKKSRHQIENLVYRAKKLLKSELIKEGFYYENL